MNLIEASLERIDRSSQLTFGNDKRRGETNDIRMLTFGQKNEPFVQQALERIQHGLGRGTAIRRTHFDARQQSEASGGQPEVSVPRD